MQHFVSPRPGLTGRVQDALAGWDSGRAVRRWAMARLPFPVLASDVRDVVYAHWVLPLDQAAALVPEGVEIWSRNGSTILTALTYAHGHFGPALLGPARRLLPSPLQSNWRFYVERVDGAAVPTPTVLFLRNLFNSAIYAVGTRLFSDALPSHLAGHFEHGCRDGRCETRIKEGGSAPGLELVARGGAERVVPSAFEPFFGGWAEAVRALTLQDAALSGVDELPGWLALARIELPIDHNAVEPLRCLDYRPGALLRALGAVAMPWCFRVPATPFRVLSEEFIRAADAAPSRPRP